MHPIKSHTHSQSLDSPIRCLSKSQPHLDTDDDMGPIWMTKEHLTTEMRKSLSPNVLQQTVNEKLISVFDPDRFNRPWIGNGKPLEPLVLSSVHVCISSISDMPMQLTSYNYVAKNYYHVLCLVMLQT